MSKTASHWVHVRDKPGFLHRIMVELAGNAHMSLEGDLSRCRLTDDIVLSRDESSILRRNTIVPTQDFVIVRLTRETMDSIFEQLMAAGLDHAIIHVQIERDGLLELGAYDNFHRNCVMTGPGISQTLLGELKVLRTLRKFVVAEPTT